MARSTYLISALGLLGLGACVDNSDSSVAILKNGVPTAGCVVSADESGDYIGSGVIDGATAEGYVFTPVVKNFSTIIDESDTSQKIAVIHGATVDVAFANPDLFDDATEAQFRDDGLTHFRVPYSGSIEPGGTISMIFEIIPADLVHEVSDLLPSDDPLQREILLVDVSIDGALGSGDFETKQFRYPVEVCNGCLAASVGSCDAIPMDFVPANTGGACNVAQDEAVDCCISGSDAVCPAVGTMPPAAR